jgi:hypothetical protein
LSKHDRSVYEPFIFAQSDLFDAVLKIIDEWRSDETSVAFRSEHTPESRAHACGRAGALSDLKDELLERRTTAENIRLSR